MMHDNRKPSKVTQKDRYGNSVTMEYAPDTKPLDPTALAKHAMEQGMEVPQISMTSMEPPMMDHPGGPKGTDTVPAWLTPGEFVVNAEAMRIPGAKEQIESLNDQGRAQQKMQGGSIPGGYMLGGNVEGAGQPPIAGYQQGGQIPAPFIAGPRLNEPKYQDDGGHIELSPLLQLYSQLTGVGQQRGTPQNDVWKKSPEQIARDNAPWWESNPDLFKDSGGWVTDALLDQLAEVESGGDNEAVSPVGAIGKYQWLPSSAKQAGYGVKPFNPKDPKAARAATKKYLENMAKYHGFTPEEALRAYNWGPGNVLNYNKGKRTDIPDEALNYPGKILGIENTQGVTPPPGEAPALPVARPGQQYDRLSDIPKQDLHRYVQPAVEQPIPRPAQLTAEDIAGLDEDINYANKGGNIGSLKNILRDPTLIPRLIEAGQKVAPLFANEGTEVPIQSNFLDRVHGQGNTSQADTPDNVVPALQNVPGNPMYDNQKPEYRFQDQADAAEKSWWQGDKGLEDSSLSADGSQQAGPSEEWQRMYDKSHPEYVSPISENKLKINDKAIKRTEEELLGLDPNDSNYDAVVNRLANLKKEQASDTAAVESKEAAKNATKDRLNNEEQANLQGKIGKLNVAAEDALKNGEIEKAAILKEQADKLQTKVETTPGEGETKDNKKSKVLNKIAEKNLKADPKLADKPGGEVETAGKSTTPEEKKKTEGLLAGLFGDLFDKKELARMAVVYLGGRALGGSHQGSLGYAAKAYMGRLDAKAATNAKTKTELLKSGKWQPGSVEAYMKSKDSSDLLPVGSPVSVGADFKNFYKDGKTFRAQKYTVGKNSYWSADGGKSPINNSYHENADEVKGTKEYNQRISSESKSNISVIKGLQERFDELKGKDGKPSTFKTEISPSLQGKKVAEWAAKNGVDAAQAGSLIEQAYHNAISDAANTGRKPRDLVPYLNSLIIRETTGTPELFKVKEDKSGVTYVSGAKMATLNKNVLALAGRNNKLSDKSNISKLNQFWTLAQSKWTKLDPEVRENWNDKAGDDTTGFYEYVINTIPKG